MIDASFLYAVAQVGITYAGFSTLVTVVAYRSDLDALPARIYYMLLLSIMVVGFSFLPVVIEAFEIESDDAWRIASGLFCAAWAAYWINAVVQLRTRFRIWGSLSFINKLNTAITHPGSALLLAAGAFGVHGNHVGAVYATMLFVMLSMSALLFLQIILDLLDATRRS